MDDHKLTPSEVRIAVRYRNIVLNILEEFLEPIPYDETLYKLIGTQIGVYAKTLDMHDLLIAPDGDAQLKAYLQPIIVERCKEIKRVLCRFRLTQVNDMLLSDNKALFMMTHTRCRIFDVKFFSGEHVELTFAPIAGGGQQTLRFVLESEAVKSMLCLWKSPKQIFSIVYLPENNGAEKIVAGVLYSVMCLKTSD